jgi:hypothetical protein
MIAERIHQIADAANLQAVTERLIEVLRGAGAYDNDEMQQLPDENQELLMPGGFPQDNSSQTQVSSNYSVLKNISFLNIDSNFSIRIQTMMMNMIHKMKIIE